MPCRADVILGLLTAADRGRRPGRHILRPRPQQKPAASHPGTNRWLERQPFRRGVRNSAPGRGHV